MTTVYFPKWLYHGTYFKNDEVQNKLDEFKTSLMNPQKWKQNRDFGEGFYTTIHLQQAREFALRDIKRKVKLMPCVLVLACTPENYFSPINHKVFLGESRAWSDYILEHRVGGSPIDVSEVISGPMADNKISNVVSAYMETQQDNHEWFYRAITTTPDGKQR